MDSLHRILVVDDNADAAETLSALLKLLGHNVRFTIDPRGALPIARAHQPDIVFLDIGMPHIDGYDVAKALRAEFGEALRIVGVTGWGDPDARAKAAAAGFDAHLVKPADVDLITAAIRHLGIPLKPKV